MSAPESTKLQINFKSPKGTLINLYADDAAELSSMLTVITEMAAEVEAAEAALGAVAAVAAQLGNGGRPPMPVAAPTGPAPNCEHGIAAKFVPPGISKASGRPYKGFYACAMDRESQCAFKQTA